MARSTDPGGSMLSIGSLKELPIKKRAALPLSVDLLITPNTVTVAHPTSATVENAIAALIAPIEGGKDFGSSVSFKQTETYTSEQAMLSLGISASHSGFDVTAKHSAVTAYDKRVITASFIQKAFTVSIDNPSTPADLFTSDFSIGDLHEQEQLRRIRAANPANIPIILNSATYGRIVYVTISSRKTFDELKDALSASVNAGGTSGSTELNAESKKILEESEITVSGIGIEESNFAAIVRTGKIQEFFSNPMDVRSVRPISYVFYNLADLSIAGLTDTAHYDITVCTPEVVSSGVTDHCAKVDANLKSFYGCVVAAAGNKDDWPTRNLRISGYRGYHGEVIANLNYLLGLSVDFGFGSASANSLSTYDRSWVRNWCGTVIEEIEQQARAWQNGYANDFGARQIYAEASQKSSDQKKVAATVQSKV